MKYTHYLSSKARKLLQSYKDRKDIIAAAHYKELLLRERRKYFGMPNVLFVFQFHNKAGNVQEVLRPFMEEVRARNIVVFSDGCHDKTTEALEKTLSGEFHVVISRNNTHEVANYRLAAHLARYFGATYIALFQDDDKYSRPVLPWLRTCEEYMEKDEYLSIIGLNGGTDFPAGSYIGQADEDLCLEKYEVRHEDLPGIGARRKQRLGKFIQGEACLVKRTEDASIARYAASVNRAPQFIRASDVEEIGYFPQELEPYQYDDYFNCFSAWKSGRKVLLAPIAGKEGFGTGGMRLYNNVTPGSRPRHFVENHNFIYDHFSDFLNSGRLQGCVDAANSLHAAALQRHPPFSEHGLDLPVSLET